MAGNDTGITAIMEQRAAKEVARKARKESNENAGVVNSIIIERDPCGLYYTRYSLSGSVPDALKGFFTSKQKVLDIIARKNIPVVE
jgi:hypothetical protein